MERFVRFILIGGLSLLTGLWALQYSSSVIPTLWVLGLSLTLIGTGALTLGIWDGLKNPH